MCAVLHQLLNTVPLVTEKIRREPKSDVVVRLRTACRQHHMTLSNMMALTTRLTVRFWLNYSLPAGLDTMQSSEHWRGLSNDLEKCH